MNKPSTKIFLDSGDPEETVRVKEALGFLDGQTTNPSLFTKSPEVQQKCSEGHCFTPSEIYSEYKKIIDQIEETLGTRSISVEVYANKESVAKEIIEQAEVMNTWAPHAHIKLPITHEGLKAGRELVKRGMHLNFTLCFSQEQAAAVHAATRGAATEQVYISPFVGRLEDKGISGIDLIKNINKLYRDNSSHVQILAASIRTVSHMQQVIEDDTDILTAGAKTIIEWSNNTKAEMEPQKLEAIPYKNIDLSKNWQEYNIQHDLTDVGLEKFANDWDSLIKNS